MDTVRDSLEFRQLMDLCRMTNIEVALLLLNKDTGEMARFGDLSWERSKEVMDVTLVPETESTMNESLQPGKVPGPKKPLPKLSLPVDDLFYYKNQTEMCHDACEFLKLFLAEGQAIGTGQMIYN